jgi:Zn-dependent protease with chaperone function
MDFFGHQEKARRKSGQLTLLFAAAVVVVIVAVYMVVIVAMLWVNPVGVLGRLGEGDDLAFPRDFWDPTIFAWSAGITALLVAAGSLYKTAVLSAGGGDAVAKMFGGNFVHPATDNGDERTLHNVVEEMALAAGTAVPRVFLIDSDSINALAAGTSINGAVIGVTRGCLRHLDRQELQGVVAHEFSHIINGDMAGNLRLAGLLHGILLLSIVGRILLRVSGEGGGGKGEGQVKLVSLLVGGCLMLIGSLGVFFGRLIKAAVSRQREFLADACAVQYTRDPQGIHGALSKIGKVGGGVDEPVAEEFSHLFFANAVGGGGIFASHPPIAERLRRISQGEGTGKMVGVVHTAMSPGGTVHGEAGTIDRRTLSMAGEWRTDLSPELARALVTPSDSAALLLSMILNRRVIHSGGMGAAAGDSEEEKISDAIWGKAKAFTPALEGLRPGDTLPLADLCLATIRELPLPELRGFKQRLNSIPREMGEGDDFFRYMVASFTRARLEDATSDRAPETMVPGLARHLPDIKTVLSLLARVGQGSEEKTEKAYRHALEILQGRGRAAGLHGVGGADSESGAMPDQCTLEGFDKALFSLRRTMPLVRRDIMKAVEACVRHDDHITPTEHEVVRAVAGVLDCPLPPHLAKRGE